MRKIDSFNKYRSKSNTLLPETLPEVNELSNLRFVDITLYYANSNYSFKRNVTFV